VSTSAAIISRAALGKLGINSPGEALRPEDGSTCLEALNRILDAWRLERLYAYATTDVTHTVVSEAQTLTIGPGGNIDTQRPERFEAGCYFSWGGLDFELIEITEAEYNRITLKSVGGLGPTWFDYTPSLPLGTLRFFPRIPSSAVLRMPVQVHLTEFADLTTLYTLPAGYERALVFTLAEEVAADYEREIPPTVARNAAAARRILKRANHKVPQLVVGEGDLTTQESRFIRGW
jgi:hypothetical protein